MATDPIRVLLIEDDPDDVLLLKESLAETSAVRIKLTHADRLSNGLKYIAEQTFDAILLDLNLPDSRGLDTLMGLLHQAAAIPIVVLSGLADDLTTLEAVRRGAQDYLVKGEISGPMLIRVLRYAIERKRAQQAVSESNERFNRLVSQLNDVIWSASPDSSHILNVNDAFERVYGISADEFRSNPRLWIEMVHPEDRKIAEASAEELFKKGQAAAEYRIQRPDGTIRWLLDRKSLLYDEKGNPIQMGGIANDITERKQAEAAIQRRDKILEALAYSGEQLLSSTVLPEHLPNTLSHLGQAIEVSRVYIFENSESPDGELLASQRYEWVDAGITPQIDNPDLQNFHLVSNGLSRWVETMKQGGTIYGNIREFPESERDVLNAQNIQSTLIVPIFVEQKWWGFIGFDDCLAEQEWFATEVDALKTAAGTLGAAIHRKRDEEALQQRAHELQILYESSLEINAQISLDALLSSIVERASSLLNASGGGLYLMESDEQALKLVVGHNLPKEYIGVKLRLGEGLSGQVAQSGEPMSVEDYQTWPGRAKVYNDAPFRRVLGIPLKVKDKVIGVINVSDFTRTGSFSEDEVRLVSLFADQAALAIDNARLFEHAERRLRRTEALREVDLAIAGSMHIQNVLQIVIKHTLNELEVDAAVVLLYDPREQQLKYEFGRGFQTEALQFTRLRLGEGYAGRAALSRQTIHVPDLQTRTTDFLRSPTFHQEGFVGYFGVPLIAKGEIVGVLEIFHREPLNPNKEWLDFMETLAGQVAIAIDNATLYKDLQRSNVDLTMAYEATIVGWSQALDLRDKETEGHTQRVTELTVKLAREMGIPEADITHIRRGALLHDIGKMGVPDSILLKPGALTDEEWVSMRRHSQFAFDMLSPIAYLQKALDIPYCHHEKWDGSGYPRGLKGEEIPLAARIFAIVDVWDALTSDRPYREAWSKEKTLEYIRELSGKHFDPQVVELFLNMVSDKE